MRAWANQRGWWGAAVAATVVLGGCGNLGQLASATTPQARVSPLVRSIESYVHALAVQSVRCGAPGQHGRKSCVVEFTDPYGQWFATLLARGSRIVADPGGVSDWLCTGACANPPPMTGNTGKVGFNTGTGNTGPTGVTGIGITPVTGPTGNGVVPGASTSGAGGGAGSNGVVYGTGSTGPGATTTPGSTGAPGVAGSNGVVYGTGSTGPGAPSGAGSPGGGTRTAPNGVVYGTGSTGPGAPAGAPGGGG